MARTDGKFSSIFPIFTSVVLWRVDGEAAECARICSLLSLFERSWQTTKFREFQLLMRKDDEELKNVVWRNSIPAISPYFHSIFFSFLSSPPLIESFSSISLFSVTCGTCAREGQRGREHNRSENEMREIYAKRN